MPSLSVLMPCYNSAITLPETLESLAQQTFTDFEVVAVDDGSNDATPQILASWAQRDLRFRNIHLPHGGIITALNTGLNNCEAPFIARMDSDDIAYPERFKRQMAWLADHPDIAVVGCLVAGIPAEGLPRGFRNYIDWQNSITTPEDISLSMFIESPLVHPSIVFRREWVERVGGYQERGWPEDYDLFLRLNEVEARFAKAPEVLLGWRDHPSRLTRTDSRYSLENILRAKAYYLLSGPLITKDAVFIWGAGMVGRRLSKHLKRQGAPLKAFIETNSQKIGAFKRGLPVLLFEELPELLSRHNHPVVLLAVGGQRGRQFARQLLNGFGLNEGKDWWCVS